VIAEPLYSDVRKQKKPADSKAAALATPQQEISSIAPRVFRRPVFQSGPICDA